MAGRRSAGSSAKTPTTAAALVEARAIPLARTGQAAIMSDSLKDRVRAKLLRQLEEDGPPDMEHDDPRQISVETDLDALANVADDDPLVEELAGRYLVF